MAVQLDDPSNNFRELLPLERLIWVETVFLQDQSKFGMTTSAEVSLLFGIIISLGYLVMILAVPISDLRIVLAGVAGPLILIAASMCFCAARSSFKESQRAAEIESYTVGLTSFRFIIVTQYRSPVSTLSQRLRFRFPYCSVVCVPVTRVESIQSQHNDTPALLVIRGSNYFPTIQLPCILKDCAGLEQAFQRIGQFTHSVSNTLLTPPIDEPPAELLERSVERHRMFGVISPSEAILYAGAPPQRFAHTRFAVYIPLALPVM